MEKNVVVRRGTSFRGKKMMANPTQKIHGRKHGNVGLQKGKYSDFLKDVQKK